MSSKTISANIKLTGDENTKYGEFSYSYKKYLIEHKPGEITSNSKSNVYTIKKRTNDAIFELNIGMMKFDKSNLNIKDVNCFVVFFDMTDRSSFEKLLNDYIIPLRDKNFRGCLIILGSYVPKEDTVLMTDEEEINNMIKVTQIDTKFSFVKHLDIGKIKGDEKYNTLSNVIFEASSKMTDKNEVGCMLF